MDSSLHYAEPLILESTQTKLRCSSNVRRMVLTHIGLDWDASSKDLPVKWDYHRTCQTDCNWEAPACSNPPIITQTAIKNGHIVVNMDGDSVSTTTSLFHYLNAKKTFWLVFIFTKVNINISKFYLTKCLQLRRIYCLSRIWIVNRSKVISGSISCFHARIKWKHQGVNDRSGGSSNSPHVS